MVWSDWGWCVSILLKLGTESAFTLRNAEGKLALSLFEPRFVVAASMPFTA